MLKNRKTGNRKAQQRRKTAKNWRFSVQKPKNWPKKWPKPKIPTPPSRTWNPEFMTVLYSLTKSTILDRKNETANPYPPKSKMQPREGQKRAIFPSLIWGEGRSRFSIYFVHNCSCYSMGVAKATLENGSNLPIFNCSAGGGILPSSYTFFGLYKLNTIG